MRHVNVADERAPGAALANLDEIANYVTVWREPVQIRHSVFVKRSVNAPLTDAALP